MVDHIPGTILFYCHSGKDRTGIISALLLALVNVPPMLIAEDYILSSDYLKPMYQQMLNKRHNSPEKYEEIKWKMNQTLIPKTILSMLSYINTTYVGIASYL